MVDAVIDVFACSTPVAKKKNNFSRLRLKPECGNITGPPIWNPGYKYLTRDAQCLSSYSAGRGVQRVVGAHKGNLRRGTAGHRLAIALIVTGPLASSAPKFEVSTLSSEVMSALVFMAWPQLQPGQRYERRRGDVEGCGAGTVRREIPDWAHASALIVSCIGGCVRDSQWSKGHAGHNLDELRSVLAHNGYVLQDMSVMSADFSPESTGVIDVSEASTTTVSVWPQLKLNSQHIPLIGGIQNKRLCFPRVKSVFLYDDRVRTRDTIPRSGSQKLTLVGAPLCTHVHSRSTVILLVLTLLHRIL